MANSNSWQSVLIDSASTITKGRGILVLMPEYRPDVSRTMAYELDAGFFDFRSEIMSHRGARAHEVTFEELDSALLNQSRQKRIVAFNVETLLAVKEENERKSWLQRFGKAHWENSVLLPIAIFQHEIPDCGNCAVIDLQSYAFHPQSMISRLAM